MLAAFRWLCLSTLCTVVGFSGSLPAAATVMEQQGLSAGVIGVISSLVYAGVLCLVPFQPWLARHLNAVPVYLLGKVLTSAGFVGLTIAHSAWTWALYTFLIGLGAGLTWPVTDNLVAAFAPPDKKGAWMGLFQTGIGGAFALGPFIASGLTPNAMFYASAIAGGVTLLPLLGRRVGFPDDGEAGDAGFWNVVRAAPALPLLGFIGGFFENGTHTAITLTALALDWKEAAAIALAGVIGAGAFVVQYPVGNIADTRGTHRVIAITLLVFIASCLPLPLGRSIPVLLWVIAFVWGAAGGCIYTLSMTSMAQRFSGARLITATSVMVMAYTLGAISGPAVAGYAVEWSPLTGPMILFIVAAVLGLMRRATKPATCVSRGADPQRNHPGQATDDITRKGTNLGIALVAAMLLCGSASGQSVGLTTLSGETRVNTTTTGDQWAYFWSVRSVAVQPDGSFIQVWIDLGGSDGQGRGIYGQRFDAGGNHVGGEFLVNTRTSGDQDSDTLAVAPDGSFIVAWDGPGSSTDVYAQRFSSTGTKIGDEFLLSTTVSGNQKYPEIGFFPDGSFVAAFVDAGQTVLQRFDANARVIGQETRISSASGAVVMDSLCVRRDNSVVLTWTDAGDVYGQVFTSTIQPVGTAQRLNQYVTGMQEYSGVRADRLGNMVIVWESDGQDGSGMGVYGRRFDANLNPLGNEFLLTANTTGNQYEPQVAVHASGNFVVAWTDYDGGRDGGGTGAGTGSSVWMRLFDAAGNPVGSEMMVHQSVTGYQGFPVIDINDSGRLVVTWEGNGTLAGQIDDYGVFTRRYQITQTGTTSITATPASGVAGDLVTVTMSLTAPSSTVNVTPSPVTVSGTNGVSATLVSGPSPAGATVGTTPTTFTWTYRLTAQNLAGTLTFGGNADDHGTTIFPFASSANIAVLPSLYIRDLTAPNLVGDSNIQSQPGAGPSVFTIGAKVTNPTTSPLTDVAVRIGDGITAAVFPVTTMTLGQTNNTYQGSFSLQLLAGASDATRPLFVLGPARNVIGGAIDVSGNGSIGPEDDGVLSNGMTVVDGRIDINKDNAVNTADDRPLPPGVFEGYVEPAIIDGYVDTNADGVLTVADLGTFGGETRNLYWQVVYQAADASGIATWGDANDIGDDLRYNWTIWGTAKQAGITRTSSASDSARVRNQIGAASNKILPSGAYMSGGPPRVIDGAVDINADGLVTAADDGTYFGKTIIDGAVDINTSGTITTADDGKLNGYPVIDGYIDVDGNGAIATEDNMIMAQPGQTFTLTIHRASFGTVGAGYDGNRDGLFDYDLWHQPCGEADWNAGAFRLIDIQSDITGTGGSNPLAGITTHYSNEPYLSRLTTSGGFDATYSYTFVVLSNGSSMIKPYQEAASGSNNEKYNGDYGYGILITTGGPDPDPEGFTALTLTKSGGPNPTALGGTTTWTMSTTNAGDTAAGDPGTGNGVVIEDEVPANTTFVSGSATSSPFASSIQYSTDGGASWTATQPPVASINRVRWHIEESLLPGASCSASFQTTVNAGTPAFSRIDNQAVVKIGDGPVMRTASASVFVGGLPDHGDYIAFSGATQAPDAALRIGTFATDGEAADPSNGTATGDDLSGDDEDLTMPVFYLRGTTSLAIPVTASLASLSGNTARLNVFVDWNGDGDVDDAGETQTPQVVTGSGSYTFSLTPPAGTAEGLRHLRLRLTEGSAAPVFAGGSTFKGEVEDYAFDLQPSLVLSIGNLVFLDVNGNGRYDLGEGVDGVTLQLYNSTQTPGVSTPLAITATTGGGKYQFDNVPPGFYRVHVPASMFALGAPLHSTVSIAQGVAGDDDVGENGIDSNTPATTGITSNLITLQRGQAPTDLNGETGFDHASDNAEDAAMDLTIDFGFANPLGVGNLVFLDANLNGHYDAGEGVEGVTVDLHRSTDTPGVSLPLASQITDAGGHYLFDNLMAGSYFVHIPASNFTSGGPLAGKTSMAGAGVVIADDSVDENGLDDLSPNLNGIRTAAFTLANNTAPTNASGETGYLSTEDSRDDNNYDLTIDLGFRVPDPNAVGVGNLIFLDANGNRLYDAGEGVDGVTVRLFAAGADPNTATPVATVMTAGGGGYSFSSLAPGSYFIQIPPSMFVSGAPLHRSLSLPGQGGDNQIDDTLDENGDDPAAPATTGVRSTTITLQTDTEPTNVSSEFGHNDFVDDIDDNNTDLTIDFGFYRPVGVGNLVFLDGNRDGIYNSGEGINGVTVELYRDSQSPGFDTPFANTTTSGGGFYLFPNLVPGHYIIHIPTGNFAPGGALAGYSSLPGQGADAGFDDGVDENGSDPELAYTEGVSSLTITLASGTEPTDQTTELGAGAAADNAGDSDTDLTVDFGFYAAVPGTFAQWQAQNPLGGQNGASQDPDGDGWNNLAEFAFGLSPSGGVLPWSPFEVVQNTATNQIDAYVRKLPVLNDVTVTLQGIADLSLSPGGWSDITTINPEFISTINGVETSAWRNLEQEAAFAGGRGFVRLHFVLDANHDGSPDAVFDSDVWGWVRHSLQPQIITYSHSFSKGAAFSGAVTSVSGATLNVAAAAGSSSIAGAMTGSIPWYIEVVSGDNEGHRFEVDELGSTDTTILLETSNTLNTLASIPASLAGDRIVLRPHWTLAEWLPPSKFRATNSSGTADKLMFYTGSTFTTTWLYSNLGNPKWVGDATLADRGTRVMDPCEALLIQPRSTSAPVFVNLGVVRAHKFASPLKQGTRLMAGGWPKDQSATSRGILYASGFTGATSATRADRVQIWLGDLTPGGAGYESHYLLKTTTLQQWVKSGDSSLTNENNLPLFKAFRGVYFNSYLGKADYVAPLPWTP